MVFPKVASVEDMKRVAARLDAIVDVKNDLLSRLGERE